MSVDPLAHKMPAWSPYTYTFNNPVLYTDPDGRIPIIPLLLKAGTNAAADWFAQTAMNYYFNPSTAGNWEASAGDVNGWQIARSGVEGLIPWRTPGVRLGKAALTATGDVTVNYLNDMSGYSTEQAVQDFTVGFIGDLAGGGLGDLTSKYGSKAVANGLQKIGFDVDQITDLTGFNLRNSYKVGFRDESVIGHIFRDDHGLANTAANKNLLLDVANNSSNILGTDKYGNVWNAVTRKDGTQVWTQSRNGKIFNGGVNQTSKEFNAQTGLSSPDRP